MPDGNIGLLEECPPAIGTGTLSQEAILSNLQVERPSKEQDQPKPREWIPVEDPTSDESLSISTTEPAWLIKAKYDLDQIAALPDRWDAYGSPPLTRELYRNALTFLGPLQYEKVPAPFVVPVSGGGVQFEWQFGERELEVEFLEPTKVTYLKVFRGRPMEEGELTSGDSRKTQELIRWLVLHET